MIHAHSDEDSFEKAGCGPHKTDEFPAAPADRTVDHAPCAGTALTGDPGRGAISDRELEALIHQWRTTIDAVNDAIMLVNLDGEILRCNAAMAQFAQRPFQEMIGQRCYELVHGLSANMHHCPLQRLLAGEATEPMVIQRNGRDYEVRIDPLRDADNRIIGGVHIFTDITKRERTRKQILRYQGQLRSLAAQLSLTEQRERERLATELHETLGQTLAFTKLKLDCAGAMPCTPEVLETLNEVRELISQAIRYTRSLTFELSPPFLAELGLFAAAEWLAESFSSQHGLAIQVTGVQGALPITDDVRGLLFRAVRELLINVIKHARAHSATVNIACDSIAVTVTVSDDGTGFDLCEAERSFAGKGKYGLFNLRERLTSLGGDTRIMTQPDHGTRIVLVAPIAQTLP
ncbi:MAG TPA: PAS domain-containing protein [Armatimonadota bacterium]|jgi:PAS domain S-box-containing protein